MVLKRIISVILLFSLLSVYAAASGYDPQKAVETFGSAKVGAESCVVYSLDRNEVIFASNENEQLPMASTTKIMTAILVLEHGDTEDTVKVPSEAVGVEGSSAYLMNGEQILVKDLLYALMLESANDAATALAIYTAGNVEAFVDMMNDKAAEIGMANTRFANPHGLNHDQHYSTAYDMALLFDYAMDDPDFAQITSTYRYETQNRLFINHNRLLKTCDGVIGGKTGYTKDSGRCLVSAAERDGMQFCVVTLNDADDWKDHARLYDEVFALYERRTVSGGIYSIPIIGSEAESLDVVLPDTSFVVDITTGQISVTVCHERFVYAPVQEGECVGYAVYSCDGRELDRVELTSERNIQKIKKKNFFEKIISFIFRN
ncbi:MAG: D-alanyl-D-alanine carboxypeptidase [Clostridia bacterium]|nr:D-alanyl-D-alanine carboxypeptidase [Clostridia bacterium]